MAACESGSAAPRSVANQTNYDLTGGFDLVKKRPAQVMSEVLEIMIILWCRSIRHQEW